MDFVPKAILVETLGLLGVDIKTSGGSHANNANIEDRNTKR